jgi:hypothetical protein
VIANNKEGWEGGELKSLNKGKNGRVERKIINLSFYLCDVTTSLATLFHEETNKLFPLLSTL